MSLFEIIRSCPYTGPWCTLWCCLVHCIQHWQNFKSSEKKFGDLAILLKKIKFIQLLKMFVNSLDVFIHWVDLWNSWKMNKQFYDEMDDNRFLPVCLHFQINFALYQYWYQYINVVLTSNLKHTAHCVSFYNIIIYIFYIYFIYSV